MLHHHTASINSDLRYLQTPSNASVITAQLTSTYNKVNCLLCVSLHDHPEDHLIQNSSVVYKEQSETSLGFSQTSSTVRTNHWQTKSGKDLSSAKIQQS